MTACCESKRQDLTPGDGEPDSEEIVRSEFAEGRARTLPSLGVRETCSASPDVVVGAVSTAGTGKCRASSSTGHSEICSADVLSGPHVSRDASESVGACGTSERISPSVTLSVSHRPPLASSGATGSSASTTLQSSRSGKPTASSTLDSEVVILRTSQKSSADNPAPPDSCFPPQELGHEVTNVPALSSDHVRHIEIECNPNCHVTDVSVPELQRFETTRSRDSVSHHPLETAPPRREADNISSATARVVEQQILQPAPDTPAARQTLTERNICASSEGLIQRSDPPDKPGSDKPSVRAHTRAPQDNKSSITQSRNHNTGSISSRRDYFALPSKLCDDKSQADSVSTDVNDGIAVNADFGEETLICIKSQLQPDLHLQADTLGHEAPFITNKERLIGSKNGSGKLPITGEAVQTPDSSDQSQACDSDCGGKLTKNKPTFVPSSWTVPKPYPLPPVTSPGRRDTPAHPTRSPHLSNAHGYKQHALVTGRHQHKAALSDSPSAISKDSSHKDSRAVGGTDPSAWCSGPHPAGEEKQFSCPTSHSSGPLSRASSSSRLIKSPACAGTELAVYRTDPAQTKRRASSPKTQIVTDNLTSQRGSDTLGSTTVGVPAEELLLWKDSLPRRKPASKFASCRTSDSSPDAKQAAPETTRGHAQETHIPACSTRPETWPGTNSPENKSSRDKYSRALRYDFLQNSSDDSLFHYKTSPRKTFRRSENNLGDGSHISCRDGGSSKELLSDDGGCDVTSALLAAADDNAENLEADRKVDGIENSIERDNDECERTALVSKQEYPGCFREVSDKSRQGRTHFSRLVRFYRKDLLRGKASSEINNKSAGSLSSSFSASSTLRLSLTDPSLQFSGTPSTQTATSAVGKAPATSSAASSLATPASGGSSGRPRVSFISGLRRLSREKTALLRVDQHDPSWQQIAGQSPSQSQGNPAQSEPGKSGRRVGTGDRKKLKVEFAVMEGEGERFTRGRGRSSAGAGGGAGLLSIKDDVENDVAMFGGSGARFRQPRVSLLGKPLNYRAHRRDIKYRKLQARIYNFLERPKSWQSWIYHLTV